MGRICDRGSVAVRRIHRRRQLDHVPRYALGDLSHLRGDLVADERAVRPAQKLDRIFDCRGGIGDRVLLRRQLAGISGHAVGDLPHLRDPLVADERAVRPAQKLAWVFCRRGTAHFPLLRLGQPAVFPSRSVGDIPGLRGGMVAA